jgi:hypothetical protein
MRPLWEGERSIPLPFANGFIGHDDSAFKQELFDVIIPKSKKCTNGSLSQVFRKRTDQDLICSSPSRGAIGLRIQPQGVSSLQPAPPAVLPGDPERIEVAPGAGRDAGAGVEFDRIVNIHRK